MPKYTIVEQVECRIEVEAKSPQHAYDLWVRNGHGKVRESVNERVIEDAEGNECEYEEI